MARGGRSSHALALVNVYSTWECLDVAAAPLNGPARISWYLGAVGGVTLGGGPSQQGRGVTSRLRDGDGVGPAVGAAASCGRPFPGTTIFVLDHEVRSGRRRHVASGMSRQICISSFMRRSEEERSNATTTTFALDRETGAPTPCGIAGDVYVASHALAEGYLNDPEKTAARFLPASHAVIESAARAGVALFGERMYATGDRGFLDANNMLRVLGRADDTVKVNLNLSPPHQSEKTHHHNPAGDPPNCGGVFSD